MQQNSSAKLFIFLSSLILEFKIDFILKFVCLYLPSLVVVYDKQHKKKEEKSQICVKVLVAVVAEIVVTSVYDHQLNSYA